MLILRRVYVTFILAFFLLLQSEAGVGAPNNNQVPQQPTQSSPSAATIQPVQPKMQMPKQQRNQLQPRHNSNFRTINNNQNNMPRRHFQPNAVNPVNNSQPAATRLHNQSRWQNQTPTQGNPGVTNPGVHMNIQNRQSHQKWQGNRNNNWNRHHHNQPNPIIVYPYYFFYPYWNSNYYQQPAPVYNSYDNSYSSYSTTTYESQPETTGTFSTTTSSGYPTASTQQIWVSAQNGNIPENAIVNADDPSGTTFYCRAVYMGQINYGVLSPNDACYVQQESVTLRFTQYEVLVSQ